MKNKILVSTILLMMFLLPLSVYAESELFEYYNTGGEASTSLTPTSWVGQSFTPEISHEITSVKLQMANAGGILNVGIRETIAGLPVGSDITSGSIDTSGNSTSTIWYEIVLTNYWLTAGTKYAIILSNTAGTIALYMDASSPTYTRGTFLIDDGVVGEDWREGTYDLMFEEWGNLEPEPEPEPVGVITAGFDDYEMTTTTAYIGDLFASTGVWIYLFIGIPLGFWVINSVIKLIDLKKRERKARG